MLKGICYYPWYSRYSNPIVGGGFWGSGTCNQPKLGLYSSDDRKIIEQHLAWIRQAGFDFLYVNLTDLESRATETILKELLPRIRESGLKYAFFIDSYQALNKINRGNLFDMDNLFDGGISRTERFVQILDWISDLAATDQSYQTLKGKPLVYIYVARNFRWTKSNNYLVCKQRLRHFFSVGDMLDWSTAKWRLNKLTHLLAERVVPIEEIVKGALNLMLPLMSSRSIVFRNADFSVLSWYNLAQPFVVESYYESILALLVERGISPKTVSATIMPGYDDRVLSLNKYHFSVDRQNGRFVTKGFDFLPEFSNDLYMFVSFNEWHEGTEIEPSHEYQDNYLNLVGLRNKNF